MNGTTEIIVVSGDPAPDGNGVYPYNTRVRIGAPVLSDSGEVYFFSGLINTTGGTNDAYGLFRSSDGLLTQIARQGQPAPDSSGQFSFPGTLSLNASNDAAFFSSLQNTSVPGADDYALYFNSGSATTQIVRAGEVAPDGNGVFRGTSGYGWNATLSDSGEVAIHAYLSSTTGGEADDEGLFLYSNGTMTQIAREGQLAPDGNGTISDLRSSLLLGATGNLIFRAGLAGTSGGQTDNQGIFFSTGNALQQIARTGDMAPDGNGIFSNFRFFSPGAPGNAVFRADLTGTSGGLQDDIGIFRFSKDGIEQIVREGQTEPGNDGTFSIFNGFEVNSAGEAVIVATLYAIGGGFKAIFRTDNGTLVSVVREGDAAPIGDHKFSDLGEVAINNSGDIAFAATLTETSNDVGIFLQNGSDTIQIIREGDPWLDSTIRHVWLNRNDSFNDAGQLAYHFTLTDGREGIALWTPVPEPSSVVLVLLITCAFACLRVGKSRGRARGHR